MCRGYQNVSPNASRSRYDRCGNASSHGGLPRFGVHRHPMHKSSLSSSKIVRMERGLLLSSDPVVLPRWMGEKKGA